MLEDGDPWQKYILASFFIGYALPQIYAGVLAHKLGGYIVLLVAAIVWTIITAISPLAYNQGGPLCLCVCRIIIGIAEGCNYPSQMALALKWFPASERTSLWTLLGTGEAAGTILAMSSSAQIATTLGWPYIFYLSSGLGVVFCVVFYFFVSKDPETHLYICHQERDMIIEKTTSKNLAV